MNKQAGLAAVATVLAGAGNGNGVWPRLSGYTGINSGLAGLTVAFSGLSSISLRDLHSCHCHGHQTVSSGGAYL